MAQTWWPRSSNYATCSTTREADSTAVTDLHDIDILSRAPQPCARFISTIINSLSASSNPTLLTDYTKESRPITTSRRAGSLFPLRAPCAVQGATRILCRHVIQSPRAKGAILLFLAPIQHKWRLLVRSCPEFSSAAFIHCSYPNPAD